MQEASITFQFPDFKSAVTALDTLEELGYESSHHETSCGNVVHIHMERNDITSALEIAQAHGGALMEQATPENEIYQSAYSMDAIRIPAHTVNEDWTEDYANQTNEVNQQNAVEDAYDVSDLVDESYNHFSADIHA
jgi:hypothetical protein